MTNKEYISESMDGLVINEAVLADMFSGSELRPDDDYDPKNSEALWKAVLPSMGRVILSPYVSSVSENGFSRSWNREKVGNLYLWLCKRYGVTADEDVVAALGVSMITDKTDMW